MLRLRMVEEAIVEHYPEQEMRCPVHLSIGQEAAAVGTCATLDQKDLIVSTHRCHGHYLAKGGSLDAMLGELYGRTTGCCAGRGGSMHLFDVEAGVLASVPIVGSTIPLGVGAALSFSQKGQENVCVVFLGDGATEEGVFHESLNFAVLRQLPTIFVVENNYYSVYTSLSARQPQRPLSSYGVAHSIKTEEVDGNDVESLRTTTAELVATARKGGGPALIVATTYRWREHCGPNYDNELGYRSIEEHEDWLSRCPIATYRQKLFDLAIFSEEDEKCMRAEIEREIEASFTKAQNAPYPDPLTAGSNVYA